MKDKYYKYAILIIIAGFLVRLINITDPILEVAMWRQCGTASIARNFYDYGMNIFYPQMVGGGAIKGYVGESEFQIYTFTVAMLYKLFGVHEYLGRLVSITAFCGGAWFLYRLALKYTDGRSGLIAILFYTFNPYMFFYSRAFQPDSTMIFLSITMLYFFSEWIDRDGWWRFTAMTLSATLAFLTKLPAVCLGLPLLYLCLKKYKSRIIIQWKLWLFATLSLVPVFLWCRHSYYLGKTAEGMSWGNFKLSSYTIYFDFHFYARIFFSEIFEKCLIYIGGVFLILGILFTRKKHELRYVHYWLIAIIISFLLGGAGTAWHTYHTLPIIAPASLLIGYAISNYGRMLTTHRITGIKRKVFVILFVLMVAVLPFMSWHKITSRYKAERMEKDYPICEAGQEVDKITPGDALVIGCLWGGPEILYYSNRKGWTMNAYSCSKESIEDCRRNGATYFVTTARAWETIDSNVLSYLKNEYKVIKATGEYFIIQL